MEKALEFLKLFSIAEANALGKATNMAFGQVAQDKKVQQFILRGKEMAHKYVDVFNSILLEGDISTVKTYDGEVTDSTEPPFSDRLMLFHTNLLITSGIGTYGMAMAKSNRKDLAVHYSKILAEVSSYALDGAKLLIKNGWMEQPPMAADRDNLANKK
ncbi:DUF3231 family protein [Evansella sp. AB-P1]|uniref:DUF3231 family protein n=1 Tax=Evansella sp. AB-P1 TaxID=3037653 RepID=UPI00242029A4|nr:DUF3231 family protein [Evansella sp. AB-P1]MDG5786040.1 DUF3231 family protein [Evansella sp. AB-P1]